MVLRLAEVDAYLINSAGGSKQHAEGTLLVRQRENTLTVQTEGSGAQVREIRSDWQLSAVPTQVFSIVSHAMGVWQNDHPAILEFVEKVKQIDGVRCIIIEDVDGQIIHFTTFADPMTEELRDKVYAAEAATIRAYPDLVFDFHLRIASETTGSAPMPIPGQRFFAVWGGLDEKSERSSQTGSGQ